MRSGWGQAKCSLSVLVNSCLPLSGLSIALDLVCNCCSGESERRRLWFDVSVYSRCRGVTQRLDVDAESMCSLQGARSWV